MLRVSQILLAGHGALCGRSMLEGDYDVAIIHMCSEPPWALKASRPLGGPAYLRVYVLAVERCSSARIASSDRSKCISL
jgi:hypothetical protein